MNKFAQPQEVNQVEISFGKVDGMMPSYREIPDEFKNWGNPFVRFQQNWFFNGLTAETMPTAKEGIDLDKALRHLAAIQRSWEPKHEHKEAAVAYLASLWLVLPEAK